MSLVLLEIDCDWSDQDLERALRELPESVQTRAGRYLVSGARRNLVATQHRLRKVIQHLGYSDDDLTTCPNGRPWLKNSQLAFNLSHSERRAVLGLSLDPRLKQCLGVDLEWMNRRVERRALARRFFTDEESRRVMADPGSFQFFVIWTRKEAVLKSNGVGLRVPLNSFEVLQDLVAQEVSGRPLLLSTTLRHKEYLVSWAVPHDCSDLDVVWVDSSEEGWLSTMAQALQLQSEKE
jgi:phosphopantetheinyl transferase